MQAEQAQFWGADETAARQSEGGRARARPQPALRPFQRQFIRAALADGVQTAVLSMPRGNGKSWLAAHILSRCLTPGDDLHEPDAEYLLCAASIEQARIVFRFARQTLEPLGVHRFLDGPNRVAINGERGAASLRVLSSSGKRAMGIAGCPLLVADEPGSWEVAGGQLMHDAIQTAQGKPGSPMRAIYVGTIAPSQWGWYHDLVERGSGEAVHVTALRGDRERWDKWAEIRRCNPLCNVDATFRRTLLRERDEAIADSALQARFLSYRLNLPTADAAELLLAEGEWLDVLRRPVPERPDTPPIVGVDLGGGRAWSAAVAVWRNGRVEALAVAPGIPAIDEQEKRDKVPRGTYAKLVSSGALSIANGLRVQPPARLWAMISERWGHPRGLLCDRFRLAELRDAVGASIPIYPRITRWSNSAEDIRALRRWALDGLMAVEPASRGLLTASMGAAKVQSDGSGNVRLVKRGHNNQCRDDVAAALVLAAGALARLEAEERHEPEDDWSFG